MAWKRNKSWNRSFMGRKGGTQPERNVYLRTLANLTNPSEVRGILQLGRKQYQANTLTPNLLVFVHRILRHRYRYLSLISAQSRDLLFAEVETDQTRATRSSMSSGERAILRISKDISGLHDALMLIDEVDTGLHPYTQQQVMLELQRIALRQQLQIIVASHSPVVLDSVPPEARIFLDRDGRSVQPLFLLGNEPPEGWIWQTLRRRRDVYAPLLGLSPQDIDRRMRDIDQMTAGMVRQGDHSRAALEAFAAELSQTGPGIARIAGRRETQDSQPELAEFLVPLGERIDAWRQF